MHITTVEDIDRLPEPKRSQVKAIFRMAQELSEAGVSFIMGYAFGGDVGATGNITARDPIPRMMKEIGDTINREVKGAGRVTVVNTSNN